MDWSVILFGTFLGFVSLAAIYDAALFVAMRERFLVWHMLRLAAMIVMALAGAHVFLGVSLVDPEMRRLVKLSTLDTGIAVTGPFVVAYMEAGMIGRRLTRWLNAMPLLVLAVAPIPYLAPDSAVANLLRHGVFAAVLILIIAGLTQAWRRGSRAARFQTAAWWPILGCAIVAVAHEMAFNREWPLWASSILVALTIEVVVSVVGVSDRFMALRRERDEAMLRASLAAHAAATDPLTGLANRRGLERRLADHGAALPSAVAILDLDHFKRVNDEHGHDIGDAVLVAVAGALAGDHIFAARTGGEEFALLLYGADPLADAEALRRRVGAVVVGRVAELSQPVTASMGICPVAAGEGADVAFSAADQALYRAKRAGRNQSVAANETANSGAARAA